MCDDLATCPAKVVAMNRLYGSAMFLAMAPAMLQWIGCYKRDFVMVLRTSPVTGRKEEFAMSLASATVLATASRMILRWFLR